MELLGHPDLARLHPTAVAGHPEEEGRLEVLLERFGARLHETGEATRAQLERVHAPAYLDAIEALDGPVWLDADTLAGPSSARAARLAAGAAIEAAARGGFALCRPPGHHALPDRAMGFCLLGNVAVAARHAQAELDAERIAIVDWDVHHGNGTEAVFRDDPSVLFVSLHQWPFWPGSGGPGTSDATTVNVPLPAGSGDAVYREAFTDVVEPAVRAFAPDLLLVSAGFDAHVADPLAQMELTADGFRELAARCRALAPRVGAVLEGGYNLATLPDLVEAALGGFEA